MTPRWPYPDRDEFADLPDDDLAGAARELELEEQLEQEEVELLDAADGL